MTLTRQLAEFATGLRFDDLNAEALAMTRRSVLDWLGSAINGATTQPAIIARRVAERNMPGNDATVIATGERLSALGAALTNGAASHVIELDDLHQGSTFHPAAPIIPAALAVAEREQAGGQDFLRSVVIGYEIGIRIAEAVNPSHYRYWHPTATCGVFGATAAAAALLRLSEDELVHALGTAGTQAAGLWAFLADGAMSKSLHPGKAAHDGILSADLADCGFTGAQQILESPQGFFAATSTGADASRITDGLGQRFKIEENGFKRHACCGHTHTAIDAALALRERAAGRQIHKVDINTYQVALDITDNSTPRTPYDAKFSIQYAVAAALLDGRASLEQFSTERMDEDDITRLVAGTDVHANPDFTGGYPAAWSSRVRITLADGTELEERVDQPKGMPANPMSDAEVEAKFHDLTDPVVGPEAAERLIAGVRALEGGAPIKAMLEPLIEVRAARLSD